MVRRELGSARKITRNGKVLSVFSVDVTDDTNDGSIRAILRARRTAIPTPTKTYTNDDNIIVVAPAIRITITDTSEDGKTLAERIAWGLENGIVQIDIDGPSAAKTTGSPLAELSAALNTAFAIIELANRFKFTLSKSENTTEGTEATESSTESRRRPPKRPPKRTPSENINKIEEEER